MTKLMNKTVNTHLKYYIIPLLPVLSIFTIIPCELYYTAQEFWDWKKQVPLSIFGVGSACYGIFILVIHFMFRSGLGKAARYTSLFLYLLGGIVLLADVFAPLQTNLATGEQLMSSEPLRYTLLEIAIALSVIGCAWRLKAERTALVGMISTFLVASIALVYVGLVALTEKPGAKGGGGRIAAPSIVGNVYHFLLDEMQTDAALIPLSEKGKENLFSGFTLYKNNVSNYLVTLASFPSYMTGSFFSKGSFEDWVKCAVNEKGLFRALYEKGYVSNLYGYSEYWNTQFVTYFTSLNQIYERATQQKNREYQDFIQIVVARSFPNFMTNKSLLWGKQLGAWLYHAVIVRDSHDSSSAPVSYEDGKEAFCSVSLMKELIATEKRRPENGQYLYAHIMLPHPPYVYDKNGDFNLEFRETGVDGYMGQVQYVLTLIEDFIYELKLLGRYDDATIIIHGDTGHGTEGRIIHRNGKITGSLVPDGESDKKPRLISEITDSLDLPAEFTKNAVDALLARIGSLLMIKPKGAMEPMQFSEKPTQLVDIYPSLSGLLDMGRIRNEQIDGYDIFSNSFPKHRSATVFWYLPKDSEPVITQLGVLNPNQISEVRLTFSGYVNKPQIQPFPAEGESPKNLGINKDEATLSARRDQVSLAYQDLDRGVTYYIGASDEKGLCLTGFGDKEHDGQSAWRWATGKQGKMVFQDLSFQTATTVEVEFRVSPFKINENKLLKVRSKLTTATVILKPELQWYTVQLTFPAGHAPEIDLFYETAQSPKNLGLGEDERVLTALWNALRIRKMSSN